MSESDPIKQAAMVLALTLSFGLLAPPTYAQIYTEDFSDYSASDWSNGYCEVLWCSGAEVYSGANCGNPNTLREYGSTDDDYIWVHFGNRGCSSVTISFDYTQWQGSPPQPDGADTKLRYKVTTSDTMSCPPGGMTLALSLNRTYASTVVCYPATFTASVTSSDRSIYFMFDKGTFPNQFLVDNVEILLDGCICGPGPCIAELNQNFGTIFLSGTVCALFPGTFESCAGAGPYISSGTACGGTGDEVMTFGSGYPYSEAILRCLNLAGLAQASLRFNLAKADGTLGPALYASRDQSNWTNIWTAPFSWGGGCQPICVDLNAYAGQASVWLKLSSGTSSTSQAHGIDDLQLVRGEACPPPTGSCCYTDGTCAVTTQAACTGTWTQGGTCSPNPCPPPDGSCCQPDGTCAVTTQAACTGTWTMFGICDPNPCVCPLMGDLNADGLVDALDIQGFTDCVLNPVAATNCRCGDFDPNGAVDLNDVSGFVGALLP